MSSLMDLTVRQPSTMGEVLICNMDELPIGLGHEFIIGDKKIAVFRSRAGKIFAVDPTCPHKQGPLADGMIVGDQIVCPLHLFRFEGSTGNCDQPGVCNINSYPVRVMGDSVYVTV